MTKSSLTPVKLKRRQQSGGFKRQLNDSYTCFKYVPHQVAAGTLMELQIHGVAVKQL